MTTPQHHAIVNALTVDVEDWIQSVFDNDAPPTDRFIRNTERVLALFDRCGVNGTFFVLGWCAEKAPELVRRIQSAGHEVQSHGYAHRRVTTQTEREFRTDLERSKKLLEDITGRAITGYRAPAFSIGPGNLWALDAIAVCGFTFDASICPAKTRRYGMKRAPHHPHRLITPRGRTLFEIPVATTSLAGRRYPAGGGGYLRLCPTRVVKRAVDEINREGAGTAIYMHPYEFAPREIVELTAPGPHSHDIPWTTRLHQGLGRPGFEAKVERLLRSCRFGTMAQMLQQSDTWSCYRYDVDGTTTATNIVKSASVPISAVLPHVGSAVQNPSRSYLEP